MAQPTGHPDLKSQTYRKARARLLANATHCDICGQPLDFTAAPRSRWAPSADHVVPRSHGGGIAGNLRAVHYGCNSRRGNTTTRGKGTGGRRTPPTSMTSRAW